MDPLTVTDRHGRLISVFPVLRDPVTAARLAELLDLTPYARAEYLACREISPDAIEDARRLLVLAHQGHGSTGATGATGATGGRKVATLIDPMDMTEVNLAMV